MQNPLTFLAPLAVTAVMALPLAAQDTAQDSVSIDRVVATVNGTDITLGHMIAARATLSDRYDQLPEAQLFSGILNQLVQQTALSQLQTEDVPARIKIQLENEKRSLIAGNVIEMGMAQPLDDAEVQAAYDADYANAEPEYEFDASHILVETQDEALIIVGDLEAGADFAEIAKVKSTGPSGPRGGALGWFGPGQMVPEFEGAVMALEVGGVSAPVETQFGWHVIILNDKRGKPVPTLAEVRSELELQLSQIRVQKMIEATTEAATVDLSGSENIDPSILNDLTLLD